MVSGQMNKLLFNDQDALSSRGTRGSSDATWRRVQALCTCQASLWQVFSRLVRSVGETVGMIWEGHCAGGMVSHGRHNSWLSCPGIVEQLLTDIACTDRYPSVDTCISFPYQASLVPNPFFPLCVSFHLRITLLYWLNSLHNLTLRGNFPSSVGGVFCCCMPFCKPVS